MTAMAKRPIQPADLWTIPRVGAPAPSPDGTRLVVPVTTHDLEANEGTTRLWLLEPDRKPRAITAEGANASGPVWSPDGSRLLFVRKEKREDAQSQVYLLPLDGGEAQAVTNAEHGAIDPRWFPDGERFAFLGNVRMEPEHEGQAKFFASDERMPRFWDRWLTDGLRWHVFVGSIEDGSEAHDLTPRLKAHFSPMDPSGSYDIAPDGKEIVFGCTRSKPKADVRWGLFRVGVHGGRPVAIDLDGDQNCYTPRYSPDGKSILFGRVTDPASWAHPTVLARYDRRRRKVRDVARVWDLDPLEWGYGPRGKIYATADVNGRTALFRVGAWPEEIWRGGSVSGVRAAGGRLCFASSSLRRPQEIYSCGVHGDDVRRETTFCAKAMRELAIGRVEDVSFLGAADEKVQMFVVHPPAHAPKRGRKRPLLHLIHGGPHVNFNDVWHPRWNAQAFAAQGYLCALVNFHGSNGWGNAFTRSIVGEWGDKPYEDVMLATDWLIERRDVDEERMAASGGSYGGYMASWIASQTRRFRCIVNHAGVCDLQAQFACEIPQGWPNSAGGDLWSGPEAQAGLDRYNPLRHVGGMKTPMLILHGEKDYRVPYTQALQLYNILQMRKVPTRIVVYPDENHWILQPANSMHWYGEFHAWLEKYIG